MASQWSWDERDDPFAEEEYLAKIYAEKVAKWRAEKERQNKETESMQKEDAYAVKIQKMQMQVQKEDPKTKIQEDLETPPKIVLPSSLKRKAVFHHF